jgi:hypothetical protein
MFQFRTNRDSSHTHYINDIGTHDIYVEWAWVNCTTLVWAWFANALYHAYRETKFADLPAKIAKSRLRDIIRDHFATYGLSYAPTALPDDATPEMLAESTALHNWVETFRKWVGTNTNNGIVPLARVWVKRSHAVRMLAHHLSTLAADAAKPRTVESLHDILGTVARMYGVNPPRAPESFHRVADDILFDCLPFYGGKQFDDAPATDLPATDLPAIVGETATDTVTETPATVVVTRDADIIDSTTMDAPATADTATADTVTEPATIVETVSVETATDPAAETATVADTEPTVTETTPDKPRNRKRK